MRLLSFQKKKKIYLHLNTLAPCVFSGDTHVYGHGTPAIGYAGTPKETWDIQTCDHSFSALALHVNEKKKMIMNRQEFVIPECRRTSNPL
jgi:hypothetical protein